MLYRIPWSYVHIRMNSSSPLCLYEHSSLQHLVVRSWSTKSTFRFWLYLKLPLISFPPISRATLKTISLRLLALILCSNCSNTFNKVLTTTRCHTVKLLFETSSYHFSLLNIIHGWSKHFTSRYDPSTPTLIKPLDIFNINYPENDIY